MADVIKSPENNPPPEYPAITEENIQQFENTYLFHSSSLELSEETNPDTRLVIAGQMGVIRNEISKSYLRGEITKNDQGLTLGEVLAQRTALIKGQIEKGEVTPMQPENPNAPAWLASKELRIKIEDYWKSKAGPVPGVV